MGLNIVMDILCWFNIILLETLVSQNGLKLLELSYKVFFLGIPHSNYSEDKNANSTKHT